MSNATARRVRVEKGIYRRPDGVLEIGWRDAQGKQRWRRVEGGISAARKALEVERVKRARGEHVAADPRLTFRAATEAWWDARAVRLRPSTQSAYGASRKHLLRHFGTQRMTTISASDVARYVARKQAEGRKGWTIKGDLTVLSSVFSYAVRHLGLTVQNPVSLLDRVERPSTADQKEARVLTPSELQRLIAAVDARHRLIFRLASETGLRLSETLGLAWADIDISGQAITVSAQLDRGGKRVPLKTPRSHRTLEITPTLAGELRKHHTAAASTEPEALVFVARTGRALDHRNVGGRVLSGAINRAKLPSPGPTFHCLRHTHASQLIAAGWDVAEVSARLGHADVSTTLRTYAHAFDAAGRSDDRRNRLTAIYGSAMEAPARKRTKQTIRQPARQALDLRARRPVAKKREAA